MATPPPTGSAAARSALAQKLSGVPPDYFVIKLYQMLQEQREVLTWDPDGGIIIHDRQRLEATLSVYFRHNRFTSFQRQLNNFGFHKKRKPTACLSGTAAQQRKGAAYDHPLLVGQQPEAVRDRRLFYGGGRGDGVDAVERWSCRGHVRHRRETEKQPVASMAWAGSQHTGRESRREVELPTRRWHQTVNNAGLASAGRAPARRAAGPRRAGRRRASARPARARRRGRVQLVADVAATELRRENSRGELEPTRNCSRGTLLPRGPKIEAHPPRRPESRIPGRASSEERARPSPPQKPQRAVAQRRRRLRFW